MLLTARSWSNSRHGISAVYVKGNIPDETFCRLMNWAIKNVDSLYWTKNNPIEDAQGLNPHGTIAIDSWNELWKELQHEFDYETEEGLAIANFYRVIADNPEILIWIRRFYTESNPDCSADMGNTLNTLS